MVELGINSGTNLNSIYVTQDRTVDEIIETHATTLEDVFDIKLQQREKKLPQTYWIPKLHKTPCRARFIAGSSSCTMTRLSKLITECLKLVRTHPDCPTPICLLRRAGHAMLMSPNKDETAVHSCRKVLATPWSW